MKLLHLWPIGKPSSIVRIVPSKRLFLAAQRNPQLDEPRPEDIYEIGVVATVAQSSKLPNGHIKVMVEGVRRGKIRVFHTLDDYIGVSIYDRMVG